MRTARKLFTGLLLMLTPLSVAAAETSQVQGSVARGGISAIWILANISYAGMRAQNSGSVGWLILSFIFGLPGTLITLLVVREGSERAYGIEIPRKSGPSDGA